MNKLVPLIWQSCSFALNIDTLAGSKLPPCYALRNTNFVLFDSLMTPKIRLDSQEYLNACDSHFDKMILCPTEIFEYSKEPINLKFDFVLHSITQRVTCLYFW